MRHKTITLIALGLSVLLLVSAMNAFAGTGKRKGTAGAMELLIPVGSVGTSLGGNYTAGIGGIEAMYWNPAGIAASPKAAEVMVSHLKYIADINLTYAAAQANFGKFGTLGFSIKSLGFGDIPVTNESAPDGTGEMYSPSYTTIGLTYGRRMTDRILFGTTVKIVSERIMTVSASGVAFDFGVQYNTAMGLKLGVSLRNFGVGMRFNGTGLERQVDMPIYVGTAFGQKESLSIVAQEFEFPTTIDIGAAYTFKPMEGHSITAMANFQNHHFGFDSYGVGLEYGVQVDKIMVSARGGATAQNDPEAGKLVFNSDDNIFGPSFGGGFFVQLAPQLSLKLDYAYRLTERLADNQWFSLVVGF
jgi:hypothetical protein